MVRILLTASLAFMLVGCVGTSRVQIPEIEVFRVEFKYDKESETVTMESQFFENFLEEFLTRRSTGNSCIKINNSLAER